MATSSRVDLLFFLSECKYFFEHLITLDTYFFLNHIVWQFISDTEARSSKTCSLLNHKNICIPSLDVTGLENIIVWKTATHGYADVSKLASEGIWQETLFKVQLLWIQFSPPPSLPPIFPPTRRQQINCHKRLFSSQTIFSFTRELSAPVSVTRQCEC